MLQLFWKCRSTKLVNKKFWCAKHDLTQSLHLTDGAGGSDVKCQRWGCLILRPAYFLPPDAAGKSECLGSSQMPFIKSQRQLDANNRICLGVAKPTLSFVFLALLLRTRGLSYFTLGLRASLQPGFQLPAPTGRRVQGGGGLGRGHRDGRCGSAVFTLLPVVEEKRMLVMDFGKEGSCWSPPCSYTFLWASSPKVRRNGRLSSSSRQWAFGWPAVAILCSQSIWRSGLLLI